MVTTPFTSGSLGLGGRSGDGHLGPPPLKLPTRSVLDYLSGRKATLLTQSVGRLHEATSIKSSTTSPMGNR
jgi:hypothetical protein